MNCQHYREVMFDYFEGGLSSAEQDDIKLHLLDCEYCRRQFELTEQEDHILRDTSNIPEMSETFNNNVMNSIKTGAGSSQVLVMERKSRFRWLPAFSKATVAAVLLLSCLYVPGILPHLQDKKGPDQAALMENSQTSSSPTLPQGNYKDQTEAKQFAVLDTGAGTTPASPRQIPQDEKQDEIKPEAMMSKSLPDNIPAENATQGNGSTDQGETSRSLPSSLRYAGINTDKPSLYNIPSGFVLKETNHISENQVVYNFEDVSVQKSFMVNVSPTDPVAEISAVEEQTMIKAKEPKIIALDNIAALQNTSNRVVEYNGETYQITVTGSMSQEELDRIAEDLSLDPLSQ